MAIFLYAHQFSQGFEINKNPALGGPYAVKTDNKGVECIGGVSKKLFPIDFARIAALPENERGAEIRDFYLYQLWVPSNLKELNSQSLANRVFDGAVSLGIGMQMPVIILQWAFNLLRPFGSRPLAMSGSIDLDTIAAVNSVSEDKMLMSYSVERIRRYRRMAEKNKDDYRFLDLWISRAMDGITIPCKIVLPKRS